MSERVEVSVQDWRKVMEQPTYALSTCLQWFLPVRLRDESPQASGQGPLGTWRLQPIRKRDLRSYEQSLAKVIETEAPNGSDGAMGSAGGSSRIRTFRFDPASSWSGSVETYEDKFRRLFQISGTKLDPEPEVVRIGLFEFDSGEVTSHYLGITMRYPLGRSSPSKASWSLGDVVDLNHQLVGSEMGGEPDESDDALLGTVQPTASWRVSLGSNSPDTTDAMPWMQFVMGLLASPSGDPDRAIGPLMVADDARPVCMTSVVVDADIDHDSGIRIAEHLGASMVSTTIPDRPLGVHTPQSLPDSLFERSDRQWYVVTQRSTALVIHPTGVAPERGKYLRETLPKEYQTQNPLLYLLALHQRRALGRILDRLSGIDLIDTGPDMDAGASTSEALDWASGQLVKLRGTQQSFHQLQAWTRYRLVTHRFGAQGFYDLVCRQHRIHDVYADVDNIIDGLESFLRVRLSELEQRISQEQAEAQRTFERRVQVFGVVFAIAAVVLAFFSVNIRGWTAEDEGLDVGVALAIVAAPALIFVVAMVPLIRERLGRTP